MPAILELRRIPFAVAGAVLVVVSIAVARLPGSFVAQLERNRPFDMSGSGWLYRLLVLVAVGQALYVGFVALGIERIGEVRAKDAKMARMSRTEAVRSVSRTAATVALLSLVYGLASFALTGERGGFWLFALLCGAQLAWYYRQTGQIAAWMEFQPEFVADSSGSVPPDTVDHTPPLAQGVSTDPDDY